MKDPIVGIDLGTSNSVVAFADEAGVVKVLADDGGYKIHPSVVSFHPNGGVIVGAAAKQRKVIDPANTIYSVKRLIGRSFHSNEVQTAMARSPFKIQAGANSSPMIITRGGEFAVPEISAIVLDHMRNIAVARLGGQVNRAVVTVPAAFNDAQRSATATAGAIAGLTVVRVLNEPTAAALAYGHTRALREVIAVYDFGGGTFDISLLSVRDQVYEVIGTAGDTFLGGDDLDERLVDKMVAKFLSENRIDLRTNEVAMMRLRAVAEQTKIELSRRSRAVVRIDEIAYGPRGAPLNLQIEITRDEFVSQVADIIDRTFPVCQEALAVAGIGPDAIADVILVGGTTKIPYVRDQVSKFFSRSPRTDVNPEDAVAIGAALQATSLDKMLSKPTRLPSRPITATAAPPSGPVRRADSLSEANVADSFTEVAAATPSLGGVTMAPVDELLTGRPKRETFDYAQRTGEKVDTSYSITRTQTRDKIAAPPPPPGATSSEFETTTPPPGSAAIGRLTRTGANPLLDPKADPKKTAFGVPAGPKPPPIPNLTQKLPALQRPPVSPVPAQSTSPGTGVGAGDEDTTSSREPLQLGLDAPPADDWIGPGDTHDAISPLKTPSPLTPNPLAAKPPATQPMSPVRPIAPPVDRPHPPPTGSLGSPVGPTLVALAPDFAEEVASVTASEVAAASTARGMGPMQADTEDSLTLDEPLFDPPTAPPYALPARPPVSYEPPPYQAPPPNVFTPPAPLPPAPAPRQPVVQQVQPVFDLPSVPVAAPVAAPNAPTAIAPLSFVNPAPAFPLPEQRSTPVILEVTPRGLGIATVAGFCEELIRRNSRLPAQMKRVFSTSRDRQPSVRIVVCQGESRRLDNNTIIGDLVLQNLPPRPRGETEIEVTFSVDAGGILNVSARDVRTGAEQRAQLDLVGGVAAQDVAASRERIQQLRR